MSDERETKTVSEPKFRTYQETGSEYLQHLDQIAREDVEGLKRAEVSYGNSWKKRGGANAWFMLCRKYDRLELQVSANHDNVFEAVLTDPRPEGAIDDIRDLRRYLMLVEAELRAQGFTGSHRDNR